MPTRPARLIETPVPDLPEVPVEEQPDSSTVYSLFRTKLSRHRTGLSDHRTSLSEFRTDLSTNRTEMSMRRTSMSLDRTRMSADRTLMSVIRTALSLIGFGFTIYQAFGRFHDAGVIHSSGAPRNFGVALILLGLLLLTSGIWRHIQFGLSMRRLHRSMADEALIRGKSDYPLSITLVTAVALHIVGILAIVGIAFDVAWLS